LEERNLKLIRTDHVQRYALYAELFKRKDDLSKARENLNKAIEILKECGADGWIKKMRKNWLHFHERNETDSRFLFRSGDVSLYLGSCYLTNFQGFIL
jgi:hypothetical protein